ncbi:DUF4961 domain-containing protein [Neolewinella antarctica]|uniref:1,4-alpha-glucan branching enzyme n=1 Tax=Neolewinella antarctica TaxID=442734 RepID=A0ABX0XB89_9BACT|nr:DUF4961 domain-containing protein [Neolewinella antarctica]NJC26330.1 1,4-alpha-glucan branching enzyme [Neolewinella antarctica]
MKNILLSLCLLATVSLPAQIITTSPAAPTDDQAVTITFDATQGTGGLADCQCDVYLHTGVITDVSNEWRYTVTTWAVADDAWKMTPVAGKANKYTYTYTPSVREYFSVPAGETIKQIGLVFRNADGTIEGKASGGGDIFIDVSKGGDALGITAVGDPEQEFWALGKSLPVQLGATVASTLEIFDNDSLVATTVGTDLAKEIIFTTPGAHTVLFVATTEDGRTARDSFAITARLEVEFTSPSNNIVQAAPNSTVTLFATSFIDATLQLESGSNVEVTGQGPNFEFTLPLGAESVTTFTITATYLGETAVDRVTFVTGDPAIADPPAGLQPGATDLADGSTTLLLRAPGKSDVFVAHNFNDFAPTAATRMNRSSDNGTFWLELTDLPQAGDLIYNYLIDGDIVQPDPYSKLVLDPFNDRFIAETTFSGIPDYPRDNASGILTWHRRQRPSYEWQSAADYQRPDPKKMVVYELLVRDFIEDHSFTTLIDTLDYLERLGVNTIELMPVNEFEGNLSWGYNPSFHMALDKYYGSPEDLKAFVDACHQRGLAVVLDIVYNHAFGQSPLARMWWDEDEFRPTADNPYLNVTATHPFNVGYDFNHESELTKEYVKNTTAYWLEEFRIDGFRWDLTKGFTQTDYGDDVDAWSRYDEGRVAILKDYADHVWSVDDETYMIMEHLAEAREEEELAQYGNDMYFWSGFVPHDNYLEASMGYHDDNKSDFSGALAVNRSLSDRNLIAYMESHDEERMQFKNESFGNRDGGYDIREEATGLDRVELASTFFYTLPGPKMLWQFGELGYDFSINYCEDGSVNESCRTGNKPIRWGYREETDRQDVYNWIADLNYLRNNFDFFHDEVVEQQLGGATKRLHLRGNDGEVVIVGNFGVTPAAATNVFPAAGDWYNYAAEQMETIANPAAPVMLEPGEYRLYLSREIRQGGGELTTSLNDRQVERLSLTVAPNPTSGPLNISFSLPTAKQIRIDVLDLNGRGITTLDQRYGTRGLNKVRVNTGTLAPGFYLLRLTDGTGTAVKKIIVQ